MTQNLFVLVKIIVFFLSTLGLGEYLRRKSKVSPYFVPALTVSAQIMALFFAGLLNCLLIVSILLYMTGIVFAVYYIRRHLRSLADVYLNVGYFFFVIMFCMILLACKGKLFMHVDNFSHWALVVKSMLLTNRYPNFQDYMIYFQEYPLGSASYIYYFARMVSSSEGMQMTAQAFLMLCYIFPVFKYATENKIINAIFVILFTNFIFCYNMPITTLLVDCLLPLQGMALLFFLYSECLGLDHAIPGEGVSILYAIPFLVTCIQIKNSGIYFVIFACLLIIRSIRDGQANYNVQILAIAAPALSLYLWHAHCNYVFSASAYSKHAMTLQNYRSTFYSKNMKSILSMAVDFLQFALKGREIYLLIAFLFVLWGGVCFLANAEMKKIYYRIVLTALILYITYMAGMLLMYIFSMPKGEAENLAGIYRYRKTILIAIYYLILLFSIKIISATKNIKTGWIYMAALYSILIINWWGDRGFFTIFSDSNAPRRLWFQQAISDYNIPSESSYFICLPPDYVGDEGYLCQYLLWSKDLSSEVITEKSQLDNAINYEYIIVYDQSNGIIDEWLKERYPDQNENTVIFTRRDME